MGDAEPLEELMSLLRPAAVLAKVITGAGQWSVRKPRYGDPAFCLMLDGSCVLAAEGRDVVELCRGDFVLFPQTPAFTMSSHPDSTPIRRVRSNWLRFFPRSSSHGVDNRLRLG
jgi:hypothetical protein